MMRMTGWFPPHIKPVHPGWYWTRFECWEAWSYWHGELEGWGRALLLVGHCPSHVPLLSDISPVQNKHWKGIK